MMIYYSALYLFQIFQTFLQLFNQDLSMPYSMKPRTANAGLASPLDLPLAQNPHPPRNGTACSEPITRLRAIIILLDQHEDDIFHCLEVARCHSSLSHDQYLAVCALKGCSDAEIRTWLKEARKLCETLEYLSNDKS